MPSGEASALPYRPCAGVVLTNAQGLVFAGQRAGVSEPAWQMPQGGIDDGEAPLDAAYRELREETGVGPGHVQLLGQTADWYRYDFPSELAVGRWKNRFRGQAQIWAHFRLTAPDSVIDLHYDDVEFSDWRWMTATDVVAAIIPFKRDIYRGVLSEFGLLSDA